MRFIYIILFIFSTNLALAAQVLVAVDGEAITSIDVNKRIEALQIANPELMPDDNMRKHVLNNLISEELFHNEGKRLKVKVSEEEILDQFQAIAKDNQLPSGILNKLMTNASLRAQLER